MTHDFPGSAPSSSENSRGDAFLENGLPSHRSAKACPEDCKYQKGVFALLVVAQFVVAATIALSLNSAFAQTHTAIIALLGIAMGVWAVLSMGRKTVNISPAVRPTAELVQRGPYRFVRHPMYTALLAFCGAYVLGDFSLNGALLWLALVLILAIKMAYEESMLRKRFLDYPSYAQRVKRIVPFVF